MATRWSWHIPITAFYISDDLPRFVSLNKHILCRTIFTPWFIGLWVYTGRCVHFQSVLFTVKLCIPISRLYVTCTNCSITNTVNGTYSMISLSRGGTDRAPRVVPEGALHISGAS